MTAFVYSAIRTPNSELINHRFPAHLPQISGCSFTVPTVSLYIQQRPHFTPVAGPAAILSPCTTSLEYASAGASLLLPEIDGRDDKDEGQVFFITVQKLIQLRRGIERHGRIERMADLLVPAERFEHLGRLAAHREDPVPPRFKRVVEYTSSSTFGNSARNTLFSFALSFM